MKITVLGSGTSTGVPVVGCRCEVCSSDEPKNKRLRVSIHIEVDGGGILVDTSPDLREQSLRYGLTQVNAVLYTHHHSDHVNGIDDLRCFNFLNKGSMPIYAAPSTAEALESNFSYAFVEDPNYLGAAPPKLVMNRITPYKAFELLGAEILPLPIRHGREEILGFRIGSFAYLTDCSQIPDKTRAELSELDVLILDGLRDRPHRTHFTQAQAVAEVEKIRPKRTYLTHITHEIDHHPANETLAGMTELDVECAYDGLVIEIQ